MGTMSSVDHRSATIFNGNLELPKQLPQPVVVNIDLKPLVAAIEALKLNVRVEAPSVSVSPEIRVSVPDIHIPPQPEPKVIIQRVDGQIVTNNLKVSKYLKALLVLPYAYILFDLIHKYL